MNSAFNYPEKIFKIIDYDNNAEHNYTTISDGGQLAGLDISNFCDEKERSVWDEVKKMIEPIDITEEEYEVIRKNRKEQVEKCMNVRRP